MKRRITSLAVLSLFCSLTLNAGTADATIKGKTESGRTTIEIRVSDLVGPIREAKLTIDGESYIITGRDLSMQTVIRDTENGLLFLAISDEERSLRFWMIPNSEKVIEQGNGVYRSRFAAVIEATDPRIEKGKNLTPRITIGCTLDWEI